MPNITLSVDAEVTRKVRKIAVDKNTTLTAMVRDYLQSVADSDVEERKQIVRKMRVSFRALSREMGPRHWKRDELHGR